MPTRTAARQERWRMTITSVRLSVTSCQVLAQIPHPYTPTKEHGKALLKRRCERMQGGEAYTDHPPTPPSDDAGDRPDIAEQPHQPIPPQPLSGGGHSTEPLFAPQQQMMRQAGQQEHHLLRLPPALPAGHQPQSLFV